MSKKLAGIITALIIAGGVFYFVANSFAPPPAPPPTPSPYNAQKPVEPKPTPAPQKQHDFSDIPEIVATINGEQISRDGLLGKLNEIISQLEKSGGFSDELLGEIKEGTFRGFINEELLIRRARTENLIPDPVTVDNRIDAIAKNLEDAQKSFAEYLADKRMTEKQFRTILQTQMSVEALIDRDVKPKTGATPEDAKKYYDEHQSDFTSEPTVKVAHILVMVGQNADEAEKKAAHNRVTAIINRLVAGEKFADVARQESDDKASAVNGGEMEFFGHGVMDPAFEQAAFATPPGKYSNVVTSTFGYHLIHGIDKRPGEPIPFDDVSENIRTEITRLALRTAIDEYIARLSKEMSLQLHYQPTSKNEAPEKNIDHGTDDGSH